MISTILNARKPLFPQLVPAVPLWTNGRQSVQSPQRPGADWFRVAVVVKQARAA